MSSAPEWIRGVLSFSRDVTIYGHPKLVSQDWPHRFDFYVFVELGKRTEL